MHNVSFLAISAGQAKKYAIAVKRKSFSYIFIFWRIFSVMVQPSRKQHKTNFGFYACIFEEAIYASVFDFFPNFLTLTKCSF